MFHDRQTALLDRHQFLRDAASLFAEALAGDRVVVDEQGYTVWRDATEQLHWEDLHAAAEKAVRRYYR